MAHSSGQWAHGDCLLLAGLRAWKRGDPVQTKILRTDACSFGRDCSLFWKANYQASACCLKCRIRLEPDSCAWCGAAGNIGKTASNNSRRFKPVCRHNLITHGKMKKQPACILLVAAVLDAGQTCGFLPAGVPWYDDPCYTNIVTPPAPEQAFHLQMLLSLLIVGVSRTNI